MAIKLAKVEYEALPESLKAKFQASGDEFELVEEDVEGLKKSKAEILQEKKDLQARLVEAEKFKKEHEAAQAKAAEADLEAKGKYEEAIAAKEKAWNDRFDVEKAEKESLFADIKRERLTNELVKRGVLADRAEFLVDKLGSEVELFKSEDTGSYGLRKKGGIGDAAEFDLVIEAAKKNTPFFFAANGASGSGATGSNGNGGGAAKTDGLSPQAKLEQIYSGAK